MLTVVNVAYPFAPVTEDPAGGAEQIVARIDAALAAAGHRSIVVAAAGSRVRGTLVALPAAAGEIDADTRAAMHRAVRAAIVRVCAAERVDAIHMHGVDADAYLPERGPPVLVTLHLPLSWYAPALLHARAALIPVSAAQAATAPPDVALTPPVPNGVDIAAFAGAPLRPRRYLLALGRICAEKGFDEAIATARLAGAPLVIAGKVFPYAEHRRWFARAVAPHLGRAVRFAGPVAGARKRRLLAGARAVLIPSRAPETSSLVAMEAAAAGAPVIAAPAGALRDLVRLGLTGALAAGAEAMAAALPQVEMLDRAAIYAHAAAQFDAAAMTRAYLDRYEAAARV